MSYHHQKYTLYRDFLKGGSKSSIESPEAGICTPRPLRDFQYFNESKLSKLLYFMQKSTLIIKHIAKCPWDEASTSYLVETDNITHRDTYSNL